MSHFLINIARINRLASYVYSCAYILSTSVYVDYVINVEIIMVIMVITKHTTF